MTGRPPVFDAAFAAQFAELLAWRRDVRRFRREPLPEGLIEKVVAASHDTLDKAPNLH